MRSVRAKVALKIDLCTNPLNTGKSDTQPMWLPVANAVDEPGWGVLERVLEEVEHGEIEHQNKDLL